MRDNSSSGNSTQSLRLHTVLHQPLTWNGKGKMVCTVDTEHPPYTLEWEGPKGGLVQTDETGCTAFGICVGEYRIRATDASGGRADVKVSVEPSLSSPVIVLEYRVGSASTNESRDGFVEAVGEGLTTGWKFLWTNGWITDTPVLQDIPCGMYTVTPISQRDGGVQPVFVHMCAPAHVGTVAEGVMSLNVR